MTTTPHRARRRALPWAAAIAALALSGSLIGAATASGATAATAASTDPTTLDVATASPTDAAPQTIAVDPSSGGQPFDGIGAISGGGGTSRLLYDYPKKQQSQVLDYLFTPGYGASLQILKVEIGGDSHSSNGAEPSHERAKGVIDCDAGYEWWLMEQAKKRNPHIALYGLAWAAPGWFDGGYWSADAQQYLIDWLDCAKQHHLTIDYLGGRNERAPDTAWYVSFRKALDAAGYSRVKLVAADNAGFGVVDDALADPAFADAVDIVGIHYPCSAAHCTHNDGAIALQSQGKQIWASESGWDNYLTGGLRLASEINHQYVDSRMTAFINWPAVYSWYPTVQYQNSGLMKANEPWSGSFDLGASTWIVAQTTQFADPGWQYVDSAAQYLTGGGTSVALVSPATKKAQQQASVVVETTAATEPQTVRFQMPDSIDVHSLQQWSTVVESTDDADWFVHDRVKLDRDGSFTVTLQPGRVYTFTTRTDGHKGTTRYVPASKPLAYFAQDFDRSTLHRSPRYFSDMEGAFEVQPCTGARHDDCLTQVITTHPDAWMRTPYPITLVGDITWSDYRVSTSVRMTGGAPVALMGRVVNEYNSTKKPNLNLWQAYVLWLGPDGAWRLEVNLPQGGTTNGATKVLASGTIASFDGAAQHRMSLRFDGDRITPLVDGHSLGTVIDDTYAAGQTGLAVADYATAEFDDYAAAAL